MGFRQSAAHVGAYGMQHIPAGQVERGCELGLPDGFVMTLLLHLLIQIQPKLHPGKGMDGVVNAAVAGIKAPQQRAVGGVDDGVAAERGDVSAPEIQAVADRRKRPPVRHAPAAQLFLQIFVLQLEKFLPDRMGRAHVHQPAKQSLLFRFAAGQRNILFLPLCQ